MVTSNLLLRQAFGPQALEEQVEAELQAERAAAEAEADRVKAAIEEKRREREQVEAALRAAVRSQTWPQGPLRGYYHVCCVTKLNMLICMPLVCVQQTSASLASCGG